jgi:hypothetical protein
VGIEGEVDNTLTLTFWPHWIDGLKPEEKDKEYTAHREQNSCTFDSIIITSVKVYDLRIG